MNESIAASKAEARTERLVHGIRAGEHALGCVPMLFTIGSVRIYEPLLDSNPNPEKEVGGSVWFDYKEAAKHAEAQGGNDMRPFFVYGVLADWNNDVGPEIPGTTWRALTRRARLIRVPQPEK